MMMVTCGNSVTSARMPDGLMKVQQTILPVGLSVLLSQCGSVYWYKLSFKRLIPQTQPLLPIGELTSSTSPDWAATAAQFGLINQFSIALVRVSAQPNNNWKENDGKWRKQWDEHYHHHQHHHHQHYHHHNNKAEFGCCAKSIFHFRTFCDNNLRGAILAEEITLNWI